MPDYPVQGGYVTVPVGDGGGDYDPPAGHFYQNYQGPVDEAVLIPAGGQYDFARIPPLMQGNRRVVMVSQFCLSAGNHSDYPVNVRAQIGVGDPSEDDYPMRPYVGVLHANPNVTIAPHTVAMLTVIRMDVIDPTIVPTDMPWQVVGTPVLVPQAFGPPGTPLYNCAFMAFLGG